MEVSNPGLEGSDTVLGGLFGLGGGGGGGDSPCPHGTLWRKKILLNQAGVKSGLKVGFLEVSNPGLDGF